jgi:hypothetical protein
MQSRSLLFLRRLVSLAAVALLLPACGGWLGTNLVASAQKKPNNAWVFFSVERLNDEPVAGLVADDFTIYEDGSPVAKEDTRQILQSPDGAAARATLLLVDLSGTSAAGAPDGLVDAARAFAERLGKGQRVGVYAYDGEEKIHPLVPFSGDKEAAKAGDTANPAPAKMGDTAKPAAPAAFDALRRFRTKDPSSNLHGAVVEGLKELRRALDREHRPLRFGTLVVAAQGIDRANRVSAEVMRQEWQDDRYRLFEIMAAGAVADQSALDEVGRDGVEAVPDRAGIKDALDRIAARIEAHQQRYYLLSFCTTARKGEREVRIEAHAHNPEAMGTIRYTFNADGLGPPPECDPKTPAAFEAEPVAKKDKDLPLDSAKDKKGQGTKPAGKSPGQAPGKGGTTPVLIDTPPPERP